jgi:DNA ligase-1
MDGVRAYWDGKRLFSKQGKEIAAPSNFTHEFPTIPLDGELWMGRNTFEKLMSKINSKDIDWNGIQYCVFDLPASKELYELRFLERG